MNATGLIISEEVFELIKVVKPRDWDQFFDTLKEQELKAITSVDDADLPKLKARCMVLDELKTLFSEIRNQPR